MHIFFVDVNAMLQSQKVGRVCEKQESTASFQ